MKVLLIVNGFPPTRWAGTETYTAAIAGELMGKGHDVQVLCCGDWHDGQHHWNGFSDDLYNGIPVRRINLNWQKSPDPQKHLYNNPVVARFMDDYLKEIEPDLVHVTSCETLSASVLDVVKGMHIPLVFSITDFWFLCPSLNLLRSDGNNCTGITTSWDCLQCVARPSKPYQWANHVLPEKGVRTFLTQLSKIPAVTRHRGFRGMVMDMTDRKQFMRRMFSLPDVRLVASEFVRDVHVENGFVDPIQLHSYGHDLSWLKKYRGKVKSPTINVGFIGRISKSKGVHLLLEAARRVGNSTSKKIRFLIYGNLNQHPDYARRLEVLMEGLENVEFCGTYPRDMSGDVFSKIDVLAVPSLWYDFPLIIHEAFSTKTPVIATNLGSMAETVSHDLNGLLFERGDVKDLVDQIRRIADEPGLLQKLQAGIPNVKSIKEDVDELEKIYLNLFNLVILALGILPIVKMFLTEFF
jgi:glycosyltransferase involved in cell wall biosynthesis